MDGSSHIDLIELLQEKIKQEEKNYIDGLKEGKQFWELKEIRNKMHQLYAVLEKLKNEGAKETI